MASQRRDDYVSITAATRRLGVSSRALLRYTQDGRLPDTRGADGRRAVAYARVSSRRQQAEGDLDRQVARLREHGGSDLAVFTDVAAGLSDRQAGLRKALGECRKPRVDRPLAGHPDRMARFGAGLIEHLLAGFGVTVTHTGQPEDEHTESELVRDMLAIVTSFAGRHYGLRPAKTKRLRAVVDAGTRDSDAA